MKKFLLFLTLFFQFFGFAQQAEQRESLDEHFQSLANAKNSNDHLSIVKEANDLGDYYFSHDDDINALQYYETAFATAKSVTNHALMGESLNNLGAVYAHQSNYKKAANTFSRAIEMYTFATDSNLVASTMIRLGKVTSLLGDYKESYKIYEKANSIARKIAAQESVVASYGGIVEVLQKLGRTKYAAQYAKLYETEKANLAAGKSSKKLSEAQPAKQKNAAAAIATDPETTSIAAISYTVLYKKEYIIFALILLIALTSVILWFRKSMRNLKKQIDADQADRDAMQVDRYRTLLGISDDLHSNVARLNSLNTSISIAKNFDDVRQKSEAVEHTAAMMNENIGDVIWTLNPHNVTIATLLLDLREYTANYFAVHPLRVIYDFPEKLSQMPITKESYRSLFVAIKATFHTIAKHSGASEVIVKAGIAEDYFSVSVIDNGEGFDLEVEKADRIANMEARFEKIGGKFTLFSKAAHGSHTTVGLPIHRTVSGY